MERLEEQNFERGEKNVIVVCTAGKGEDSWTPVVNGVVDMDEQICKNSQGFLQLYKPSAASKTQRRGRGGRFRYTLHLDIWSSLLPQLEWRMPDDEELAVVLAALGLGFGGPIPGMGPDSRPVVENDLAKLALCQRDKDGALKVTTIGDRVCLLVCKHVEHGYDPGNVLPRYCILSLIHDIIAVFGMERERSCMGPWTSASRCS